MNWLSEAQKLIKQNKPAVLITVAAVSGSSPREAGAKMLVTGRTHFGTIGGGALEKEAVKYARTYLKTLNNPEVKDYPLGPSLAQCCGGFVRLAFEKIDEKATAWLEKWQKAASQSAATLFVTKLGSDDKKQIIENTPKAHINTWLDENEQGCFLYETVEDQRQKLWIFGAGHVAKALVTTLAPLDLNITMLDSRANFLKIFRKQGLKTICNPAPFRALEHMPEQTMILVMTQSHAIDFDVCYHALLDERAAFIGLIGSATKKARFLKRLRDKGLSENTLRNLTCPIGIGGIMDKRPEAIAIDVAAQLLKLISQKKCAINAYDQNAQNS